MQLDDKDAFCRTDKDVQDIELSDGRFRVYAGTGKSRLCLTDRGLEKLTAKPFLKWAGGKQWLAPASGSLTPPNFEGRYYEPFFGGGAFYFASLPKKATLADKNRELIDTYSAISEDYQKIVSVLRDYKYDETFYYQIRDSRPRASHMRAARLIFLNRSCWNGLYRVNRTGQFNVPFGSFSNPTICDVERLKLASEALASATLRHGDFASILRSARSGDFVYLDPPYITGHKNNGFHKYNAQLFSWSDQQRLSMHAKRLSDRGVYVLITNADHPEVNRLYAGFRHYRVHRGSLIASGTKFRSTVTESLFSNYPLGGAN